MNPFNYGPLRSVLFDIITPVSSIEYVKNLPQLPWVWKHYNPRMLVIQGIIYFRDGYGGIHVGGEYLKPSEVKSWCKGLSYYENELQLELYGVEESPPESRLVGIELNPGPDLSNTFEVIYRRPGGIQGFREVTISIGNYDQCKHYLNYMLTIDKSTDHEYFIRPQPLVGIELNPGPGDCTCVWCHKENVKSWVDQTDEHEDSYPIVYHPKPKLPWVVQSSWIIPSKFYIYSDKTNEEIRRTYIWYQSEEDDLSIRPEYKPTIVFNVTNDKDFIRLEWNSYLPIPKTKALRVAYENFYGYKKCFYESQLIDPRKPAEIYDHQHIISKLHIKPIYVNWNTDIQQSTLVFGP